MASIQDREKTARLLRQLGHDLAARRPSAEVLRQVEVAVEPLLRLVEQEPLRESPIGRVAAAISTLDQDAIRAEALENPRPVDSVVAGPANPIGLGAQATFEGDDSVVRVTLGPEHEGFPGIAHGGIVAALFDEVLGQTIPATGVLAYTATLDVQYSAPAPIGELLEFRASITSIEDRKVQVKGFGTVDGQRFAEAESLYIVMPGFQPTK